jgi:hypothetical protein
MKSVVAWSQKSAFKLPDAPADFYCATSNAPESNSIVDIVVNAPKQRLFPPHAAVIVKRIGHTNLKGP